jgi:hypothetical protein
MVADRLTAFAFSRSRGFAVVQTLSITKDRLTDGPALRLLFIERTCAIGGYQIFSKLQSLFAN